MKVSLFTFRQNVRTSVNKTKQTVGYGSKQLRTRILYRWYVSPGLVIPISPTQSSVVSIEQIKDSGRSSHARIQKILSEGVQI